jgi:hypothetical protein
VELTGQASGKHIEKRGSCYALLWAAVWLQHLSAHGHDKHHETTYVSMDTQVQHRMCFKEREIKEK